MTTDKFLIYKTRKDRRCNNSFPVRRNDQTNLCRFSLPIPLSQVTKHCTQAEQQLGSRLCAAMHSQLAPAVTHYLCCYSNMTATFPGLKAITLCLMSIYTYSILLPSIFWSDEQGTRAIILLDIPPPWGALNNQLDSLVLHVSLWWFHSWNCARVFNTITS